MAGETNHCLNPGAGAARGAVNLPVAPRSNTRPRFGAAATPGRALQPRDVVQWLDRLLAEGQAVNLAVVCGPGDALAEPGPALETLRLLRAAHPEVSRSLTTNGLNGADQAPVLAELGLSHVTVLVDAVDPAVAERLYAWIRPGLRTLPQAQAAALLVQAQARAIAAFKAAGLFVKVNTTLYPGINQDHVEQVARAVRELGADLLALVPFQPAACEEGAPARPTPAELDAARTAAARHMTLCGQEVLDLERQAASPTRAPNAALPQPVAGRPNVAVASAGGLEVDLHLGQAVRFLIFGPREGDGLPSLLGVRDAPEPGGGDSRWQDLAASLADCFAVLAASAGEKPRQVLGGLGLTVLTTEADVQAAVDALYGGGKKGGKKAKPGGSGASC